MAHLIHMRPLPSVEPHDVWRVLSDAETTEEALIEALDALRERTGGQHAVVLKHLQVTYAPKGSQEHMPAHDIYTGRGPVVTTPLVGPEAERPLCDVCSSEPGYGTISGSGFELVACAGCIVNGRVEELAA